MATVCGGMKNRMTKKEKAEVIRTMAKGCNIPLIFKKRIQEGTVKSVLCFFGECKTPEDIEAKCRELQEICELNRPILERAGFDFNFDY